MSTTASCGGAFDGRYDVAPLTIGDGLAPLTVGPQWCPTCRTWHEPRTVPCGAGWTFTIDDGAAPKPETWRVIDGELVPVRDGERPRPERSATGWICPRCEYVNAPHVDQCRCSP